jgi:hypothetical protein
LISPEKLADQLLVGDPSAAGPLVDQFSSRIPPLDFGKLVVIGTPPSVVFAYHRACRPVIAAPAVVEVPIDCSS